MPPPAREQTRPLEAGARLAGKYRLLCRLGEGGMGQVWRARNETTGADVALKVLHDAHDASLDARFRNEAKLASMLSHRSIVRIFDLLEEPDGTLALVMELLYGESLAQYLKRQTALSTEEAVAIALPILSALEHAHASGVVHRDVTPGNVFLAVDPDGSVLPKLVDFGIAKLPVAGSLTIDGRVLGTPRYMAPEQIRAAADIDGRADLFSVGVTLYEAITGSSPFDAPTPGAALAAVLESPVDSDPRIEPRVWVELQRALAKRPYERHADAREMADGLRTAIGLDEGSLAALLRRDPRTRDELAAANAAAAPGRRTGTVGGQSLESASRPRGPGRGAFGLVALAALLGAGALFASLHRTRDRTPTGATAPTPAAAQEASAPAPSASEPPTTPGAQAPAATPATSTPHTVAPRLPRAPVPAPPPSAKLTRPVATTPGF